MKKFFNNLFTLFVPNECPLCHASLVQGENTLCLVCQSKLPRVGGEKTDNGATDRLFGKFPFVHGTSFCYYRSGSEFASLIVGAKYKDRPWINKNLAFLFATELASSGWPFDIDLIIPVPIHSFRKIIRGYNQSEPIAVALSKAWNLHTDTYSLRKITYTRSQVSHTAQERLDSMEGTFSLRHPERFFGKHVLLVDDVLTTGATLQACAQLLIEAGARVSFLTLGLSE